MQKLAQRLAAKSPLVLRRMKEIANRALDPPEAAALRDEMLALRDHLRSTDVREGLGAFVEKARTQLLRALTANAKRGRIAPASLR